MAQTLSFDYDRSKSLEIRTAGSEMRGSVRIDDISFDNLAGARTAAYLVLLDVAVGRDTMVRSAMV